MYRTFEELKTLIASYNEEELEKVTSAYEYAKIHHAGQYRQSGEEYITHPVTVAYILAKMHADGATLCAGLLHDTLEDTKATYEEIEKLFGKEVANLVLGVTKAKQVDFLSKEQANYYNIRKILLAVTHDPRILIIKLADRLHNMRTLGFKDQERQKQIAHETLNLYVPLAYYLGAYQLRNELEDLSLSFLDEAAYQKILEDRSIFVSRNEKMLNDMILCLHEALQRQDIDNEIILRIKNAYGIYKKLMGGSSLKDIHDLMGLKILVPSKIECYESLGIVHQKYQPLNEKFKDYISVPKTNMYQSLHTTLYAPNKNLVQARIKTRAMDQMDMYGIMNYWTINEGKAKDVMLRELSEKFQFFKSLQEIDRVSTTDEEFVWNVQDELLGEKIYIHNPFGSIIELPKGATALDFAFAISADTGLHAVEAIINDNACPINTPLQTGDRVIINTDPFLTVRLNNIYADVKTTKARTLLKTR